MWLHKFVASGGPQKTGGQPVYPKLHQLAHRAIVQQFDTGEVLMLAWMNREAVEVTLMENRGTFWSRSRNNLWRKGETSGQIQQLKEFRWDCDQDTILLQVDQKGVACHTGRRSCFYYAIREGEKSIIADVTIDPDILYK